MAVDAPASQSEEPPQVTQSTTVEPNQITVTKTTHSSAPSNKKGKPTGERFQRVKSDQAVYMDDRLRDMSYAAKVRAGANTVGRWRLWCACECRPDCHAR